MTTNALQMDKPVEHSLLDDGVQGIIGKGLVRVDGPLKVAGQATYAAEYDIPNLAHGFLVRATFAAGKITAIDAEGAKALPGVIDVVVDLKTFIRNPQQGGETNAPTQGVADVAYFGEPVAIVVAESFEVARDAAALVVVRFEPATGVYTFDDHLDSAAKPPPGSMPPYHEQGDLDRAMAGAAFTVDDVWRTPSQNSAAMEPHASIAVWDDDGLTLYGSLQMPSSDKQQLAKALGERQSKVRIVARYIGGGFGSKLGIAPDAVATAIAAKAVGRPVKTVMTRQQVFEATLRRSNTQQRLRLAADADGTLTGIGHETLCSNLPGEGYFEPAGQATSFLYGGENRVITHDLVELNQTLSGSMRAPGEAVGLLALENAMDELAELVALDPVELRRRNDPDRDPQKDIPYSSRALTRCLDEGARAFGWETRNRTPGGRREGDWLIGQGMASTTRANMLQPSEAAVSLGADGRALVETDMTDIGTGTYTILAQIAGEMLGLPVERVDVHLGDTKSPPGAGSGGSWGAGSAGSSVYLACESLRQQLAKVMEADPADLTLKDGHATAGNRRVPLTDLIGDGLTATGSIKPGKQEKLTSQASYGAHFCEVKVHAVTGEVRVTRWHATFAAGRILNQQTARSQCIGGIVFGIGTALTEDLVHDDRDGRIVNHDLAEYHVPVHADVPAMDIVFLDERDIHANPLHAKGIGELGIGGAGAAVTNAIYNATGIRVRDYPATLDKLLEGLPVM
ncbi:xanthine dehydrogenase [Sphingomonas sp. Leaf407]|uniref:xanthine dehydrogenase family protein molybdopterin-binding subunit n=1 Tax=unclassified Sphingomonas TaxID=196159 RepID=UPI0006F8E69E|nr:MULTISPECIES: xanthine dehydrogenase family protein molybdopterin-binding subunit [unclassified Sphingomonas]KQN39268.1 xanthine dehydrogenase [Sphingomonas sp. Leaf42]KQT28544.1 xanthine dehydrogenase [Sphingomonas sp. Leaf407]